MASYQNQVRRVGSVGLSCLPADLLPPDRVPYLLNMRTYAPGQLQVRSGIQRLTTASPVAAGILSLARLNDPTPFATQPVTRFLSATDGHLYAGAPFATSYTSVDSGYSGNPIQFVQGSTPQSPRPWMYLADSSRMRKINSDSTVYPIGLAQPTLPPVIALGQPGRTDINLTDDASGFTDAGSVAGSLTTIARITTTISQIVFDSGSTGYASIAATSMAAINGGCLVVINYGGSGSDTVIVDLVIPAVAPTTVGSIVYESGSTGPCWIQPAASLGTGVLDTPPYQAYLQRAGVAIAVPIGQAGLEPQVDLSAQTPRTRPVDFPVGGLLSLDGAVVRIEAIAVGPTGLVAIKVTDPGTHSAGDAITGIACFRAYCPNPHVVTDAISFDAVENVLTFDYGSPLSSTASLVGGVAATGSVDGSLVGGQAVLDQDLLHLSIRVDRMDFVNSIRLYLDVDASSNDFLHNYYVFEWRASDIATAIQGTNTAEVDTVAQARTTVVTNQQVDPASTNAGTLTRGGSTRAAAATSGALSTAPGTGLVNGAGTSTSSTSAQLAVGNDQWVELTCRVTDLIRVGTDPSQTLASIAAIQILVNATSDDNSVAAITVDYNAVYLEGGYGPDVGDVGDPYVYRYRYRSGQTGEHSNVSPPSRGGVLARRQRVICTAGAASTDPQADTIDWFRSGGNLGGNWTYVGTGPNSTADYDDDAQDLAIQLGATPPLFHDFQPWPTLDRQHVATVMVAGPALLWLNGDLFDVRWAPGSLVIVHGLACTIDRVISTTVLLLNENAGSNASTACNIPAPTLLSQTLPSLWGPDNTGIYYGCGDADNPGTLYWSQPGSPDLTDDANAVVVTSGSEILQAGFIWDGKAYVASTERIYAIEDGPVPGSRIAVPTAVGRGFWTRWAFAVDRDGVTYLAKDGIARSAGGAQETLLTDPDLHNLFPHDGVPGVNFNGIPSPDLGQTVHLQIAVVDGSVYFDYLAQDGTYRTLVRDPDGHWILDTYAVSPIWCRLEEPGAGVHNQILGSRSGDVWQYAGDVGDGGTPIAWAWWSSWEDYGDTRRIKQFGDVSLNANLLADTCLVTVVADDGTTSLAPVTLTGNGQQETYLVDINNGAGILARNVGIHVSGASIGYLVFSHWETTALGKTDSSARRASDWDNLGTVGAKFVQGVILRANTFSHDKQVQVQYDGGTVALTLIVNHDGEITRAYPLSSAGWTPFVAHLVRLVGADDVAWQLYDDQLQWVFEPQPELATAWATQPTTHDLPGYFSVRDMVVAYVAPDPVTLLVAYQNGPQDTYLLGASPSGQYTRLYVPLAPRKGTAVSYTWSADSPFSLYKKDMSVRVQGWGLGGGYQVLNPFGGPSRSSGAEI